MDGKNLTAWQFNGLETLWKTPVMGNPVGLVLSEDASKAALIFPKIGTAPYVRIFDATSGTERAKVALSGDVNSPFLAGCAFWKNRYVLLGFKGSGHYPLLVVDAEKGEECTAKYLSGEGEEIGSADDLQFSPDARSALFLEPSGFGLWRVDGVQAPGILLTDETNDFSPQVIFRGGAFSPDGQRIAIAAYNGCRIYDVKKGELIKRLEMGADDVRFSPDGTQLLLVDGARLSLVSTATWELISGKESPRSSLYLMAFQPKGALLAATDGLSIFVWNTANGHLLARLPRPDLDLYIMALTFHPDNRHLIAGDGKQFWSWDTSAIRTDSSTPASDPPTAVSFFHWDELNPDSFQAEFKTGENGEKMALTDDAKLCAYNSGPFTWEITVRALPEGKVEALLPLGGEGVDRHRSPATKSFSKDGKLLVAAAVQDNLDPWHGFYLWETASFKRISVVETYGGWIKKMAFGDHDQSLAVLNSDSTISVWDVKALLQPNQR